MPTGYFPNTDKESGQEEPPKPTDRREKKGVSGNLRTADNTVSRRVTWPHKVIYSPSAQPATYEHLSPMAFVDGFVMVRLREPPHLQELMEDRDHYGWPVVRAYHAAWLQHIEQGWAAWGDAPTKLIL